MRIAIFCLSAFLSLSASAEEVQNWLERLAVAEQKQSFEGTFVYERNGSFSTHAVWRLIDEAGDVKERLLQLDGRKQEVFKLNNDIQCVSGSMTRFSGNSAVWPAHDLDIGQLANWYEFRVTGQSRVAGRPVTVLALIPRDAHRYGYELYLDDETALPLKSLLLGERGKLLERFQFTHFQEGAPQPRLFQPGDDCLPIKIIDSKRLSTENWHSEWLPPGFTLHSVTLRRSAISNAPVTWLMYDDGLAHFSVFLEALQGAPAEDANGQVGPTSAVSRRLQTPKGDVMVTVVGEIPPATAERIALSIRLNEEQLPQ